MRLNRLLMLGLTGIILGGIALSGQGTQDQPTAAPPTDNAASLSTMKAAILEKNIFKPARIPKPVPMLAPAMDPPSIENLRRPLKRPFRLIGISATEKGPRADLFFPSNSQIRTVRLGDTIETITILDVEPTYMLCDYAGTEIRIGVGESSDDALAQIRGYGMNFELKGTTIRPDICFAYIQPRGETQVRRITIGSKLGEAVVVAIQPGEIQLRDPDGFEYSIKATGHGKP